MTIGDPTVSSAERSVWASTYAFFDGPRAFEVLATSKVARALDVEREDPRLRERYRPARSRAAPQTGREWKAF